MTLMNRIFGDWAETPFAVHVAHHLPELSTFDFTDILNLLHEELFDIRTGKGSLILSNPGQMKYQSGITVAVIGSSWSEAAQRARQMPERLKQMIREQNLQSPCQ